MDSFDLGEGRKSVLILIFLENALRRLSQLKRRTYGKTVLILIFLENALRQLYLWL